MNPSMNDNNDENGDRGELEDRLLDGALREVIGIESPPDLSGRIFAAAKTQAVGHVVSLRGEGVMNERNQRIRVKRNILIGAALAASLLIAVGLMFPDGLRKAKRTLALNNKTEVATSATIETEQRADEQIESVDKSEKDELMKSVTPRLIIQDEDDGEEDRLGITEQADNKLVTPAPTSTLERFGIGGRVDVNGPVQTFTEQLNKPGRQTSLGKSVSRFSDRDVAREFAISNEPATQREQNERWYFRQPNDGRGPGSGGDQYTRIHENPFVTAEGENALSTFSIDVDTAAYANVRQFLMQNGQLPPPDAVRIEELVNYFDYDYSGPTSDVPFAAHVEVAGCPWQPEHRLVRIGIKGREIERNSRPLSNLVFLIDVSGSMNQPNKLRLLVEGMKLLTRELGENDRVAIVVYASSEGLALDSTPGDQQDTILSALGQLRAGGSTAGGAGIELAYKTAQQHFITGGVNRVILATDGDFNVGVTSPAELERMAETKAKETGIFLTVLGFGRGNLNDAMMEQISGKGNGNYHYIDNRTEARKVLVEEMAGTLVTIAKDVKIQIEFNPAQVAGHRLIGYENRVLANVDFNDDKKDAGEIGAGHTVTALYEIVPSGKSVDTPGVDPLKYQQPTPQVTNSQVRGEPKANQIASDELLTLKIRYKQPDGDKSTKLEFPINDGGQPFAEASGDFQFAAAVASFGMLLRNSEHRGSTSFDAVLEIAEAGAKRDEHGYRAEFLNLVRQAKQLRGE